MVQGGGQRVIPSPGGLAGWKRKRHACPSAFRAVFQVRSLNSLTSLASRRTYEYAIEEFIAWHCSEPRLAFNRIVVTRYRTQLEARGLAAATINQRLAAVRRLACEASDCGLLSADLAAGIQRGKGCQAA